jgi:hypothetical protein
MLAPYILRPTATAQNQDRLFYDTLAMPAPYILRPTPYALQPTPYALQPRVKIMTRPTATAHTLRQGSRS